MSDRRDLARHLAARILSLPGVRGEKSRWTSSNAYYVGSREFAHFHNEGDIDVRLTKRVQRERAPSLRNDTRVKLRERPSEWVALSLRRTRDVDYAFEMVKLALEANRSDNSKAIS